MTVDLKKSSFGDSGDSDPDPTDSLPPRLIYLSFNGRSKNLKKKHSHQHPYGTRSKTQIKLFFKHQTSMRIIWKLLGGDHL